jgi:hypothetical protein
LAKVTENSTYPPLLGKRIPGLIPLKARVTGPSPVVRQQEGGGTGAAVVGGELGDRGAVPPIVERWSAAAADGCSEVPDVVADDPGPRDEVP